LSCIWLIALIWLYVAVYVDAVRGVWRQWFFRICMYFAYINTYLFFQYEKNTSIFEKTCQAFEGG